MQGIDHLKFLVSEIFRDETNGISPNRVKELSIAIVGKTNSGKSTLLNTLRVKIYQLQVIYLI